MESEYRPEDLAGSLATAPWPLSSRAGFRSASRLSGCSDDCIPHRPLYGQASTRAVILMSDRSSRPDFHRERDDLPKADASSRRLTLSQCSGSLSQPHLYSCPYLALPTRSASSWRGPPYTLFNQRRASSDYARPEPLFVSSSTPRRTASLREDLLLRGHTMRLARHRVGRAGAVFLAAASVASAIVVVQPTEADLWR